MEDVCSEGELGIRNWIWKGGTYEIHTLSPTLSVRQGFSSSLGDSITLLLPSHQ